MINKVVKKIGIILAMSLMLAGCAKSNVASSEATNPKMEEESRQNDNYSENEGKDQNTISQGDSINSVNPGKTGESREIRYIEESIDIFNLPDGTYPVKIFFDGMKRNEDSLSLDFMIYTVIHYNPEDINNMKRDDIIYEYVDETTTNNYVVDTVNFPIDEVCVINGGSERGEGLTLTLDESGLYRVSVNEVYTRNASHGVVTMEIPDTVSFSDNNDLSEKSLSGEDLYNYFKGLSDSEKEYFNENNTFLTVSEGKVVELHRIYLP